MKEYKILLSGKDDKILLAWEREKSSFYPDGIEYSVHTLSLNNEPIWGHYFTKKEDALEYFEQYNR